MRVNHGRQMDVHINKYKWSDVTPLLLMKSVHTFAQRAKPVIAAGYIPLTMTRTSRNHLGFLS